jgi:pimeloyl-ACP methyl ester carboxylesterase
MVHELHALLVSAAVESPYVLVGHSFGGALVQLYAHAYPNEVAGMVLVDAAHEDLFVRIPAWRKAVETGVRQFRALAPLSAWGLMALSPHQIPNRGFPDDAIDQYRAVVATTGFFDAAVAESAAFEGSLSELRAARALRSSNLPLIVISRGRWGPPVAGLSDAENQQARQMWQILQAELVSLSSQSTHVVADQSDHDIPIEQPHLVAEAIRQVVHDTHR